MTEIKIIQDTLTDGSKVYGLLTRNADECTETTVDTDAVDVSEALSKAVTLAKAFEAIGEPYVTVHDTIIKMRAGFLVR